MSLTGNPVYDVKMEESLHDVQQIAFHTSFTSGFHEADQPLSNGLTSALRAEISQRLMLIVSEAAEAMEEVRTVETLEDLVNPVVAEDGKVNGFGSELADIIIRVWDTATTYGIDLPNIIMDKMKYNKTRSHRHGRKF